MSRWEARLTAVVIALAFTVPSQPAPAASNEASVVLETLIVKGKAPATGYKRELFEVRGTWADLNQDGCDTRNEILQRDLLSIATDSKNKCIVLSGVLTDPYSGNVVNFKRGNLTSQEVPIEHVVAVKDAWIKGAFQWDTATRINFYNDPLNLLASTKFYNSQKRDGDAATWLPPLKSYRCKYVARQIAVKAKYQIWITSAEKTAMKNILAKCPGEKLPS